MINFIDIECFLAIIENGGFSAAARKLYISQQTLSERIKKIEKTMNVKLINRTNPLSLTMSGECFAKYGADILEIKEKMLQEIDFIASGEVKRITIGISTYEVPIFLPDVLAKFTSDYPDIETIVTKRFNKDIGHNMIGIDLFISYSPLDENLQHAVLLEDDSYMVVVDKGLLEDTYKGKRAEIEYRMKEEGDIRILKDLKFIVLLDRWKNRADYINLIFKQAGFEPVIGFQSENGELNNTMCALGVGAHICTASTCEYIPEFESLEKFPIKYPALKNTIAISYERDRKLNQAEMQFVRISKNFFKAYK